MSNKKKAGIISIITAGILALAGLYFTSIYSFLLFHSLAEGFSIVVAYGIFIITWNTRQYREPDYLLFLGIAYLFVGSMDSVHTLAYSGMGVFHGYSSNLATQLWIASRAMESLSLLTVSLIVGRKIRLIPILAGYTLATALLLILIFSSLFPTCYIDGRGLTPFKKISEYSISLVLIYSVLLLNKKRALFDTRVFRLIAASILVTVASEIAFTFYVSVYGISNLIGHYFKLVSFYLIYKAIIETGFKEPYNLLFRKLELSRRHLLEERDWARAYLDVAGVIIVALGLDEKVRFINKTGCEILGYSKNEIMGRNWFDTFTPETIREKVRNDWRKRVEEKIELPKYFEEPLITKTGEQRIISWHTSLMINTEGSVVSTLCSGEDITELKAVENRLRRRNRDLQALNIIGSKLSETLNKKEILDMSLKDSLPATGAEGGLIYLYDQKSKKNVLAAHRGISETVIEELTASLAQKGLLKRALKGRNPLIIDNLVENKDAHCPKTTGEGWCSVLCVPLKKGEYSIGLLVFCSRETHRFPDDSVELNEAIGRQLAVATENARLYEEVKLLSDNLRAEKQRLKGIVDQMPIGLVMINANKRIIQANPEARRHLDTLTGMSSYSTLDKIGGYPLEQFFTPSKTGDSHVVELEGPPRRVYEIQGKSISRRDFPHDRMLIVNERTQNYLNREQSRLQERLAAVGRLAAGIAHDFNNILTGIIGFAQYLHTRSDIPDYAKDHLNKISEQGMRAADLIQQILDFSRQSVAKYSPLNLVPFIKEFHKFLRGIIPENISIELEADMGNCWVHSNPTQIQQIVTNLAANARDAMLKGGKLKLRLARITMEESKKVFEHSLPPGEWILLSVSDTGTGIPKDIIPHIFNPFFTTKEAGQGSGLGLAQVYGLVRQNEGYIEVKSREGRGSTFYICLPAIAGPEKRELETEHETPKGKGETVLIVENEPEVLEVVRLILEELGYRIKIASNGKDALVVFEQNRNDLPLVLTDMVMPEMGGTDLCRILKQKYPSTKVIAMSGYPIQNESEGYQCGDFDGWLQKPVSVNSVAKAVSEIFNEKIHE